MPPGREYSKVLLLTDIPPCGNLTAGLALDQLCRMRPAGSIACFAVVNPHLEARLSPDLEGVSVEYRDKPPETPFRPFPGRLGGLAAFVAECYRALVPVRRIAKEAVRFGRKEGVDAVWCVLQGQTMIRLAIPVATGLGVPLLSWVWDPPGWWMREYGVDSLTAARVVRRFDDVLRRSSALGAASWAMAEEYSRRYGVRAVAVVPGLDSGWAVPPASGMIPGNDLVIGVAGQLYASDEWSALLRALGTAGWRVAGRDVRIRLLGRQANLSAAGEARVEFLGWAPQQEAIRILAGSDILYCPYWFSPRFEAEARLCFPSKVTTYLAAGRPILFHGPSYASPSRFLEEHAAAIFCRSLDEGEILKTIARLATDPAVYGQLASNGHRAFFERLTLEKTRESFSDFLRRPG